MIVLVPLSTYACSATRCGCGHIDPCSQQNLARLKLSKSMSYPYILYIAFIPGSNEETRRRVFIVFTISYHRLSGIKIQRTVLRRDKFNVAWALVCHSVLLPIASRAIYPAPRHPMLNFMWATLAMALSSLSVVSFSFITKTRSPVLRFRIAETS